RSPCIAHHLRPALGEGRGMATPPSLELGRACPVGHHWLCTRTSSMHERRHGGQLVLPVVERVSTALTTWHLARESSSCAKPVPLMTHRDAPRTIGAQRRASTGETGRDRVCERRDRKPAP